MRVCRIVKNATQSIYKSFKEPLAATANTASSDGSMCKAAAAAGLPREGVEWSSLPLSANQKTVKTLGVMFVFCCQPLQECRWVTLTVTDVSALQYQQKTVPKRL